jgi:hypothetical protein
MFLHTFCPLPLTLLQFKAKSHVCVPKMTEDGLSTYFASPKHILNHVINLLSLLSPCFFIWPKGEPECGSPGVWAWCPNSGFKFSIRQRSQFQCYLVFSNTKVLIILNGSALKDTSVSQFQKLVNAILIFF